MTLHVFKWNINQDNEILPISVLKELTASGKVSILVLLPLIINTNSGLIVTDRNHAEIWSFHLDKSQFYPLYQWFPNFFGLLLPCIACHVCSNSLPPPSKKKKQKQTFFAQMVLMSFVACFSLSAPSPPLLRIFPAPSKWQIQPTLRTTAPYHCHEPVICI